VNRLRNRVSRW